MASQRPGARAVLSSDDETESVDLDETSSPVQGGARSVVRGFASLAPRQQAVDNSMSRSQSHATVSMPQTSQTPGVARSQSFPIENNEVYGQNGYLGSNVAQTSSQLQTKIDSVKEWSTYTMKCTKQWLAERLGRATRTVEPELEAQIESLRDTQRRYQLLLQTARALAASFSATVRNERMLSDLFTEMSHRSPELQPQFLANGESQKVVAKNGDNLLVSLNFLTTGLDTLCTQTIEDTLQTVNLFEKARIEYDAYRGDLEQLRSMPKDSSVVAKIDAAEKKFEIHREKYDRLKANLIVKLKFLDANRVKVMHKHLVLLNKAMAAYFSANQTSLDAINRQLEANLQRMKLSDGTSFLERNDNDK